MHANEVDENQMLTTAQAAVLLGLKAATLSNWREDGSTDLPFSKFGRSVRYRYADVVAFAEARRCTSTLAARHLKRTPAIEARVPPAKLAPRAKKASRARKVDRAMDRQLDLLDLVER